MSADNCIAILHTRDHYKVQIYTNCFGDEQISYLNCRDQPIDAWRVTHMQGPDEFQHIEERQLYMLGKYMHDTWGKCTVFYDGDEATAFARKELVRVGYTEYGIWPINATEYSFL